MQRYHWKPLNRQQVGTYVEYFVKMEFTMFGFQVYGAEVDDRGIDFVARHEKGNYIEVQVKSVRTATYVFMQKEKFPIQENFYLALGVLKELEAPQLYLIPSTAWLEPNEVFVNRDYVGLKSKPEWGVNISKKNHAVLEQHNFQATLSRLTKRRG